MIGISTMGVGGLFRGRRGIILERHEGKHIP